MRPLAFFLFAFLFFLSSPPFSSAAETSWQGDREVSVRLVSAYDGTQGLQNDSGFPLGLEVKLGPGWHTYWRNVGDTGLPPVIDWRESLSDKGNLSAPTLLFPVPQRFTAAGIESIGYKRHVLFPIDAKIKDPSKPVSLDLGLDLLVCSDLCVPRHFDLSLTIPADPATPSEQTDALREAHTKVPVAPEQSDLRLASVERTKTSINIEIKSKTNKPLNDPTLFIESDPVSPFTVSSPRLSDDGLGAVFTVIPADTLPESTALASIPLTVTATTADGWTLEQRVGDSFVPIPDAPTLAALWVHLLLALAGGFILNLMPCVLPVLSLKLLSVLKHAQKPKSHVRRSFLFSAMGIVSSFVALAFATLALKYSGRAIGWGIQFQNPLFLLGLIALLTLFASNLWGLFDIALPQTWLNKLGTPHKRQGKNVHSDLADFATGAFATLLATPCSAPFLGTAVGFALAAGTIEIIAIFAALGIGMAVPYLLIAARPSLAALFPKPGAWMEKLRHVLGFFLALTALWLGSVLSAQIPAPYLIATALLFGSFPLLLLVFRHKTPKPRVIWLVPFFALLPSFLAPRVQPTTKTASSLVAQVDPAEPWQSFDAPSIEKHIAQGQTIFVTITADWCLTCKVNKRFTLQDSRVQNRLFGTPRVVAMLGDWTVSTPEIDAFLKEHGRAGVPFSIVFGPNARQGIILPELLTPNSIIQALDTATDFSCRSDTRSC